MNTTTLRWRTPAAGWPEDGADNVIMLVKDSHTLPDGSPIYGLWYGVECYATIIGETTDTGFVFECDGEPVEGEVIAWAYGPGIPDILEAIASS
jgi:hypothetical protein